MFRAKRRYAGQVLDEALRSHQVNRCRKLDDRAEAHLISLACTPAPEGRDHWTLRAPAGRTVEPGLMESLSHETVRLRLKKGSQAPVPQRGRLWCIPRVSAGLVAHMEHVLELYAGPCDPARPVVCFDGTPNLFITCDRQRGWRHVEIYRYSPWCTTT